MTARETTAKDPESPTAHSANPTGRRYFDGREMFMVHDMFRREFALLPGLVVGVKVGDHARAQSIGDHIEALTSVLHHHHRSEDEYVWPLLVDRCADSTPALTGLMEGQHQHVAARLHDAGKALSVWRASVTADSREALFDALDRLLPPLREHLTDEEELLVPLMERHITAAEFNEIVQKGSADAEPEALPLGFGMLMYEGDPEIIDRTVANMPADIRPVIKELAAKAFAEHSLQVHGTATPPPSTELSGHP
jgi:hemerythrin-like domain-containing protein